MSSSQDVRYSLARVEQGRDLANKLWNASRLVLMNAQDVEPAPRPETAEDRWIVSRLQRMIADITARVDAYEFSHAALDLYAFLWSEFCDWYLEMVKPRLYEGDEAAAATVLYVLEETLALLHPLMPFVTEEIYGFVPGSEGLLAVRRFPVADDALIDEVAERETEAVMEAIQRLRRYREEIGSPAGERIPARLIPETEEFRAIYERSLPTIAAPCAHRPLGRRAGRRRSARRRLRSPARPSTCRSTRRGRAPGARSRSSSSSRRSSAPRASSPTPASSRRRPPSSSSRSGTSSSAISASSPSSNARR